MNLGERGEQPKTGRFVPGVEWLEDRTVPAGNVQVMLFDGTLYVAGDDLGNQIWIAGTGTGSVMIRALDDTTTINGQAGPISVSGIKHDLYIRMFGGDDQLLVTSTRNKGTLNVDTGDGNDILGISDAGHRSETTLATGAGDDNVILNGSVFRRYVYLDTGAGDDTVIASSIGVADLGIFNPAGSDYFENRGSTIARPATIGVTSGARPTTDATTTDTTAPTPTITTTASAQTNTSPIAMTVTFDEDVTGFDTSDVTVNNGTVTSFTQQDARVYLLGVTPTGQGTVSVTVGANAATDAAGNGNVASNTVDVTYDNVAPVVAINAQTSNSASPTITGTVDDSASTVQVTVNGTAYTATVSGTTWSVNVTDTLTDGTYSVSATATDAAGNVGTASNATGLTIDAAAPTIIFTTSPTVPTNQSLVTVTITFSEDVTDFTTDDVTVTNGTKSNFQTVTAGRVFTIDVTPTAEGTVAVSVPAGAAVDASGNQNTTNQFSFVYDTTPPAVTVDAASTGEVTGTSSDTAGASGVQKVEISILDANGTGMYYSGSAFDSATEVFLLATTTDGFATWSYALTAPGTYTVNAKATDNAGNVTTISTPQSVVVAADTTPPTATITAAETSPTNAGTIHVTVTFDEDVTDFTASDLTAATTNGTASNLQSTNARTYTFEIVPTADGPVTFTLGAGAVTDLSGNANVSTPFTINSDRTAPVATFTSNQSDPTNASTVVVTIDFGEDVAGVDAADFTVTNGTFTLATVDARHYTVTVTPTGDGQVTVTAAAGTATDAAGNVNAVGTFNFVYDATVPVVSVDASAAATGTITGTASDLTTGVTSVEVSVFDSGTTMYWDGTAFNSATEVFLPATNTGAGLSTWELAGLPPGTYTVNAKATDGAGNIGTNSQTVTVI
ncbi:Uncharacterized protein OS=Arthrospira sp. GN=ARTHRO_11612 PE=4 SV=1: SWM_repeat: Big_3_4: Big_3_2: Big_3_2 [Gemmata massiliana]|uniref:Bacterial Ig-like domain-containing protein n=1 Tax=Gemmata massiliana TaxID=1210884 RepID=A0A6P2CT44_9BACT|nr:Ig-like domain-containing protein [Gemmata massiliana]VTR92298.1 Uncharacterized protein OS=Arthrospira sp. GN=ARTHRO_11612 PE=4 SV=1: SWM_repeat: Big_3_4: Big_3_2: Big_3_2 [Gemmata massiliana]